MDPTIGQTCRIRHCRKGLFSMQVSRVSDEWMQGTVVDGVADAILDCNVKLPGESITIRRSYIIAMESAETPSA